MSETEISTAEPTLLARSFETTELVADGRTVEMRCAPFDMPTIVADPPDWLPYEEEFARGAFANSAKAPNRVLLEFEHFHPGLSGIVGRALELEERDDALYGKFKVYENPDGDKALEMIHDGVLGGASVFFAAKKSARTARGVMRRLRVHLDRVALCREGAYPGSEVLAVRSKPVLFVEERNELEFDPILAEALKVRGIDVPEQLARAAWSTAYIDNLPDSAFLYIEPGGSKDDQGRTTPRSLRHFPYKGLDANVDLPHLRDALSRIPQSNLAQDVKDRVTKKAQTILDKSNQ